MLSEPIQFSYFKGHLSAKRHWIVKLTDGSTTWYFATTEIKNYADGHIYGILEDNINVKRKVDWVRREAAVSDVTIVLNNLPYRNDSSGNRIKVCSQLTGIVNKAADVYMVVGEYASSLARCLHIFSGFVAEEPVSNEEQMTIKLRDNSRSIHKRIPANYTTTDFDETPPHLSLQKSPLVYGKHALNDYLYGTGLSVCSQISEKKFLVADHVVNSISSVWIYVEALKDWVEVMPADYTATVDDSGKATVTFDDPTDIEAYAYLYPTMIRPDATYNKYANFPHSHDKDSGSIMSILAGVVDGDYYENQVFFQWPNYEMVDDYAESEIGTIENETDVYLQIRSNTAGGIGWDGPSTYLYSHVDPSGNGSDTWLQASWNDSSVWGSKAIGGNLDWFGGGTNEEAILWKLFNQDFYVMLRTRTDDPASVDDLVLSLREIRLRIKFQLAHLPIKVAVECEGRKFGSWIDNGGRTNSFNEGDLIEHPAFIIESILRDVLNPTGLTIDESTFDDVYEAGMNYSRLNLYSENQKNSYEIIRLLCEQMPGIFEYNTQGEASIARLNDKTPTADKTIYWYDIIENSLKVEYSAFKNIINQMIVNNEWHEERQKFEDVDTYEHSTSQTNFGTRQRTFDWKSLAPTGVSTLGNTLVHNSDALYSNKHEIIKLKTGGVKFAALDLGDHIELDSATCDPHLKRPGGASWSGIEFMIIEKTQTIDYTQFTAIKLY